MAAETFNDHSTNRIVALFDDSESAYEAVSELKDAGFTSAEIGVISRSENQTQTSGGSPDANANEGVWEKLKHFFTDESPDGINSRESLASSGWDQNRSAYYQRGIGQGGAVVTVSGGRLEEARQILQSSGGDLRETGFEPAATTNTADAGDDNEENYRFQLRGEVLRTFRERVQRGEVRLRKEVITEKQSVEVPVTREELVIERVPVSGEQVTGSGEIGSDREIRVQLSEERARVEKEPVVTEEVRVGKRKVQTEERLSENVRREELRVDKDGDAQVDDRTGRKGETAA